MLRFLSSLSADSTSFYKKVFSSVVTHGLGLVLGFVGSIILARTLGAEGRGVVSWIIAIHIMSASIVQLGMPSVNRRYVAEDPDSAGTMIRLTLTLTGLACLIVLPAAYIYGISDEIGSENHLALIIAIATVPLLSLADCLGNLQVGMHRAKGYNYVQIAQKATVLLCIIGITLAGLSYPLYAIIATIMGVILKFGIALWLLRDCFSKRATSAKALYEKSKAYMWFNFGSLLAHLVISYGLVIMLGVSAGATEVGLYAVAMVLIEALSIVPRMFSMYIMPNVIAIKDPTKKAAFKRNTLLILIALMTMTSGFFWLIAPWLIPFLFGEEFVAAVIIFQLLLIGKIFQGAFLFIQSLINAEDNSWRIMIGPIVSAHIVVISAHYFFEDFGALAAGYTWMAASAASATVSAIFAYAIHKRVNSADTA